MWLDSVACALHWKKKCRPWWSFLARSFPLTIIYGRITQIGTGTSGTSYIQGSGKLAEVPAKLVQYAQRWFQIKDKVYKWPTEPPYVTSCLFVPARTRAGGVRGGEIWPALHSPAGVVSEGRFRPLKIVLFQFFSVRNIKIAVNRVYIVSQLWQSTGPTGYSV